MNAVAKDPKELGDIPIRPGSTVCLRDLGEIKDTTDIPTGYALVNGRRTVYILVTKRADASTLAVLNEVKANLPRMKAVLPEDVDLTVEFDQSPHVTRALWNVGTEAGLGAFLTGLMVFLFLRDWRSVLVVVLNIPFALLGAVAALWLTGESINLMTLGGLALAVGILVDEATVEVENIHTQFEHTPSIARAVRLGNAETAVPRLLAMLCILAVFIPSFFMEGAARALFVPLSLAVGFSMVVSYFLSSTFVPVLSVWLLRHQGQAGHGPSKAGLFGRLRDGYAWLLGRVLSVRWLVLAGYLGLAALVAGWWLFGHRGVGTEIFPTVDAGQLQMRLRAPTGTRIQRTEELTKEAIEQIKDIVGPDKVGLTLAYVGTVPGSYPINAVYLWMSGPEEAMLRVALKPGSGLRMDALKEQLRGELKQRLQSWLRQRLRGDGLSTEQADERAERLRLTFEPADIVNDVMSFGSATPIDVQVSGPRLAENRAYAEKIRDGLAKIPALRDLQFGQALDYPTVDVTVDREKLGRSGATVKEVADSLLPATSSSRYMVPMYWPDPASGIGFQVQVEIPLEKMTSIQEVELLKVTAGKGMPLRLQDVAGVKRATMPGQYDRYNMRRVASLTANVEGEDLGNVAQHLNKALAAAGAAPRGVEVDVRGQVAPMQQMFGPLTFQPPWTVDVRRWFEGLAGGLILAVAVIFLLLTAYYQSPRLALVVVATIPLVLAGVMLMLFVTRTTLNLQSFMGAIMAIGVAVANAILLATFADKARREGMSARDAALDGAKHRLRPILMTSCAMIAGMIPLALGLGEGGEQAAPLGRAVIGGLVASTFTTLTILPCLFALIMLGKPRSPSLDPDDPASPHHETKPASV
jgi:multidrug efflux pump subunit AcrB